ncbi:hypothetical protein [Methanobrevibacter arboriphilus]|nr:hypothetical protein [Methanobrevibacter arboriphilus]
MKYEKNSNIFCCKLKIKSIYELLNDLNKFLDVNNGMEEIK